MLIKSNQALFCHNFHTNYYLFFQICQASPLSSLEMRPDLKKQLFLISILCNLCVLCVCWCWTDRVSCIRVGSCSWGWWSFLSWEHQTQHWAGRCESGGSATTTAGGLDFQTDQHATVGPFLTIIESLKPTSYFLKTNNNFYSRVCLTNIFILINTSKIVYVMFCTLPTNSRNKFLTQLF